VPWGWSWCSGAGGRWADGWGLGGLGGGVWRRSALFFGSVLLRQGWGNRPRGISGGLLGWFGESSRFFARWALRLLGCGLQATKRSQRITLA
jgi:hypothetical protein